MTNEYIEICIVFEKKQFDNYTIMGLIDSVKKKLQDKIAEAELLNKTQPDKRADQVGDVLQGLKNLIGCRQQESKPTETDWENFIKKERIGTKVKVTKIDAYNDTMVFFVYNEDNPKNQVAPIIYPCSDGNPVFLESVPLEEDRLLIERDGIQLPIIYNLTVRSYFISDFVDVSIDFILKSQGITETMLHLREQFDINCEPNFFVRHIRQGIFAGVSSVTNMATLPIGFSKQIKLQYDYFQYCRRRRKATITKTLTGQLVFSQKYSIPAKDDLKQHTIFMRVRDDEGQYINCYFTKLMIDYFDTPPDNSEITVRGNVNVLDGSFEVDTILFGNYDIIERQGNPTGNVVLQHFDQKIKIASKKYPKVWNVNNPPVPIYVLFYSIWGIDEHGTKHMSKMINPLGILPDSDEAQVDLRDEFVKVITGSKTGIKIKKGDYNVPGGHGLIKFAFNAVAGNFANDRLTCRLIQHKVFKLKDAVRSFKFIKTPKFDPSKSYIPTWRFDENDLHFFIIEAETEKYQGRYAAFKKGALNCSNLLNEELLIEGGINKSDKVIQIEKIYCHGANLTGSLSIPFRNADFNHLVSIEGRVVNVEIEMLNSSDYKDWLFSQTKWYRKDASIELMKFYYNMYSNQNHTFDFLLPVYFLDIQTNDGKIIKCCFRPMWFDFDFHFLQVNPIPVISQNDSIEIITQRDDNGYYHIKSILNKSNNSYGYSVIDPGEDDLAKFGKQISNNNDPVEIEGTVASDIRILYFGINPENFDFLKGIEYFSNQNLSVYDILPQQVLFLMQKDDDTFFSCMAPLDLILGIQGFDRNNERIPMMQNVRLHLSGKFTFNGVFEIGTIDNL